MCGFVVYFPLNKKIFNKKKFIESSHYINHRGPDSCKSFFHNEINLIFYRLRIRDLTTSGDQPMFSFTRQNIIVFNGEIYNSEKLKKKLDYNEFAGKSDTEVLINLYEKYGLNIINELEGMFSFIIYNFKKKKITAVRDRFGIKPLYYYKCNDYIFFSSEIKPIIKYTGEKKFNEIAFANFFFKQQLDNENVTFFKNIYSLKPSSYLITGYKKNFKIKRYWNLRDKIFKDKNLKISFKQLFDQSIEKHLISDTEVGLLFSGGTDSTAIALGMLKQTGTFLKTFTYDFSNYYENGESSTAKSFSKKLKIKNFKSIVTPKYVESQFDNMCLALESPFTSIRLFGVKKVYENIRDNKIKVAIEGGGGDEILGGYEYNYLNSQLDKLKKNKKEFSKFLLELIKKKDINLILNQLITLSFQEGSTKDCTPFINIDNFNKDFLSSVIDEKFYFNENSFQNINFLQKSQLVDIERVNLPRSLKYMDRLAMIAGVENRVPFLDHKLANYSFHLDNKKKIKNKETRYILKQMYKRNYNLNFFTKQKKSVVDPQRDWMRKELKDFFQDEINSKAFKENYFFNHKNIQKNYQSFLNDKRMTSFNLFQIFSSFRFIQKFISF